MKKIYKAMLLVLCAALLVAGSVMGTMAYLQMETGTVTNTFTVGNVSITLKEYKLNDDGTKNNEVIDATAGNQSLNNIKLIPSRKIHKNPVITVAQGSEKCYLFVKIVNNIPTTYGEIDWTSGAWTLIDETNGIYTYTGDLATNGVVDASTKVDVFTSFSCKNDITAYNGETNLAIEVTAYAVQAEGFGTAQEAWTAANFN